MTANELTTYTTPTPATREDFASVVALVVDGLTSEHSRRAYRRTLEDFLTWWDAEGRPTLSKAIVQRYKRRLQDANLAPSTINQRLSAIRKLAREAADNGLIPPHLAAGIERVSGVRSGGVRTGNWLSREQAEDLLNTPDASTLKGLRDRAILAMLLGGGLRRAEAARLTFEHVQQRDGRWALVDIMGKRNKVRTVPIPSWAKVAIDAWADAAGIREGLIFRSVRKGGRVNGQSMTPQAIYSLVREHAGGLDVAAHDLRRTFAKLAYKGGSALDQIQLSLGHASIQTTERYLGVEQDLTDAPCDRLGLRLGR